MKLLAALAVLLPWSHRTKAPKLARLERVDEADLRAAEQGRPAPARRSERIR